MSRLRPLLAALLLALLLSPVVVGAAVVQQAQDGCAVVANVELCAGPGWAYAWVQP